MTTQGQGRHRGRRPRGRYALLTVAALLIAGAGTAMAGTSHHHDGSQARTSSYDGGWGHFQRQFADPLRYAAHRGLANLTGTPDCTLAVPRHPLTAEGLATPYVLNSAGKACAEDEATGAFVQATIFDPATGALSVYDPEVITPGMAAPAPPVPVLPRHAVIAIWTGFNGGQLRLTGHGARDFVNFAQQSYANSPALFAALREAGVQAPAPGVGNDGLACPTTRDASVVDQDPSDNVPVTYAYGAGASNGSDEQLLNNIQAALGCGEWKVPLLDPGVAMGDGNGMSTSGVLQELQASQWQGAPEMLVPGNDEFTTTDGNFVPPNGDGAYDPWRNDLYRAQVDQPPAYRNHTAAFCQHLVGGAVRLGQDQALDAAQPAPAFAQIGTNLANVLAGRFTATWQLLDCQGLTGMASPVAVTTDANGLVTGATYPAA